MYGGFPAELESLKRDKNVLMMELVRLRQAQAVSTAPLLVAGARSGSQPAAPQLHDAVQP
jgi:heat shock transcription factor